MTARYQDVRKDSQHYRVVTDIIAVLDIHGPMGTRQTLSALSDLGVLPFGDVPDKRRVNRLSSVLTKERMSMHPRVLLDQDGRWVPAITRAPATLEMNFDVTTAGTPGGSSPMRIAYYLTEEGSLTRPRVAVYISPKDYSTFGHTGGVVINYLGSGRFAIVPGPDSSRPRFAEVIVQKMTMYRVLVSPSAAVPGLEAFGVSDTEGTAHPGVIITQMAPRPRLKKNFRSSIVREAERIADDHAAALRALEVAVNGVDITPEQVRGSHVPPDERDLREILIQVSSIERATQYRLVRREDDTLAWQAPMITLG